MAALSDLEVPKLDRKIVLRFEERLASDGLEVRAVLFVRMDVDPFPSEITCLALNHELT